MSRVLVVLGQPLRLGSLGIHVELVERLLKVDVPAVAAHGGEDEARAVGSPRRRVVLAVAGGELPLVATVEADDEDVLAAVARPADAVELEEDAGEPPRRRRRSSSSSYASSGTRRAKAIRFESGDHATDSTDSLPSVSFRGSPPSAAMT